MDTVPSPPPESPPAGPDTDSAVAEAPSYRQVIDVGLEMPRAPPVMVSQLLGSSVSLSVPKSLRSVPMAVTPPRDAANLRGWLQLDVHIPPGVVAKVPHTAPTVSAGMAGAAVTGPLGLDVPFAHSKCTGRDRVVPMAEFGGIGLDLE